MRLIPFFLCFFSLSFALCQEVFPMQKCLNDIAKLNPNNDSCLGFIGNENVIEELYIKYQYNSLKYGTVDSKLIDLVEKDSTNFNSPFYLILKGDILAERGNKNDTTVYNLYSKAFDISTKRNNKLIACQAVRRINQYLFKNQNDVALFIKWVNIYEELSYDDFEKLYAGFFRVGSMMVDKYYNKNQDLEILPLALKLLEKSKEKKYKYLEARLCQLIGVNYDLFLKDSNNALIYYNRGLQLYQSFPHFFARRHINDLIFNIGTLEQERGNLKEALSYFRQINQASIKSFDSKDLITINDYLYTNFKLQNKLDSALYYLERKYRINDSLDLILRANEISEIEAKYQNEKKEKENLELRRSNRNILIGAGVLTLLGALIIWLFQKNTSKKRKLAEQQEQIQKQKVETLLKEQELISIDAMIVGQEKERQKVANELHDDLGSLMATVKLHFDNVKGDKKDPALKNAQQLLEEAYQKIRGMAHAKNSGVMANQGLVPAVNKMAKVLNETSSLQVSVEDYGMQERLENSLELTIFRIIQELMANIIKHAEASTASIQFTQHKDKVNIIVEDNGKGFDMSTSRRFKTGMGLGTIEKRIEHLEGTFTVDSVLGKGTSILIDIPI